VSIVVRWKCLLLGCCVLLYLFYSFDLYLPDAGDTNLPVGHYHCSCGRRLYSLLYRYSAVGGDVDVAERLAYR